MRRIFSWRVGFVAAVGVVLAWLVVMALVPSTARSRITVSKETTFVTEPLDDQCYVDYFAALNAAMSKGVTPDNNAAVLLYQAFGPNIVPAGNRVEVANLLGLDPLPEGGAYLERWGEFLRRKPSKITHKPSTTGEQDPIQAASAQLDEAMRRPWSQNEFPRIAEWLAENEKPIEMVVAATKRPRYFFPYFREQRTSRLCDTILPLTQRAQAISQSLCSRVMLRLKEGKTEQAWQDLLACHRLGRLMGQGPSLVEALVGCSIEGTTRSGDVALANCESLSAIQPKRFAEDLQRSPSVPKTVDKLATGERFSFLDSVSACARGGLRAFDKLSDSCCVLDEPLVERPTRSTLLNNVSIVLVDWNEPMRMANVWYDRYEAACAKPSRADRKAAIEKIETEFTALAAKGMDPRSFLTSLLSLSPRRDAGREIGRVLVAYSFPSITHCLKAEDRAVGGSHVTRTAFALAGYRAEHRVYPDTIAQLCPQYVAAVPVDPLSPSSSPLHYHRVGAGYVLYSVGPNGKDDGGKNRAESGDVSLPEEADDIVIQMPLVSLVPTLRGDSANGKPNP